MNFKSVSFLIFSCLLTLCHTQAYYSYPAQKRSSYDYRKPNYYDQSRTNYQYTENRNNPVTTIPHFSARFSAYHKQSSQRNYYPYRSWTGSYKTEDKSSPKKGHYRSAIFSPSTNSNAYKNSYYSSVNAKPYLSNSYNSYHNDAVNDTSVGKYRVSKADSENAKFAGAENQENGEDGRTAFLKRRKFHRRFGGGLHSPCFPYGRDAGNGITPPPAEQGRFLWDINVYNVYPQSGTAACHGYGGSGLGGGLLSDPIDPVSYYPPGAGIANFLSLFAPGILQNSLAVTTRPQQFADQTQNINNDLQNDPEVDPNYRPATLPVRRPNQVFYDSAGAPPVTPGQLVGGISTTVNGIIQQLTGNVQPVYG